MLPVSHCHVRTVQEPGGTPILEISEKTYVFDTSKKDITISKIFPFKKARDYIERLFTKFPAIDTTSKARICCLIYHLAQPVF